jgi:DNA-binding HxlR family transcriptional regulator
MKEGYGQFCPIAKATEIFATRWTPLVLRELLSGVCTFNDIHRGVPLMSRALLSERLRQLEREGIIEKTVDGAGARPEYRLTDAGEAFREVIGGLAQWGLQHARDRLEAHDLDPGLYMWKLRTHIDKRTLPSKRIFLRFEFTGVPKSRTSLRLMWLALDRTAVEICVKDPGYPVDLTIRGDIAALVAIFLRHAKWNDKVGKSISLDGSRMIARAVPKWLSFNTTH